MVECELDSHSIRSGQGRSFNRYMVECECLPLLISPWMLLVLIDTWWNVNLHLSGVALMLC